MRAHEEALEAEQTLAQLAAEHQQALEEVTAERDEALAQLADARDAQEQVERRSRGPRGRARRSARAARRRARGGARAARRRARHPGARRPVAEPATDRAEPLRRLVAGHDEALGQLAAEHDEDLPSSRPSSGDPLARLARRAEHEQALAPDRRERPRTGRRAGGRQRRARRTGAAIGERLAVVETRVALETEAATRKRSWPGRPTGRSPRSAIAWRRSAGTPARPNGRATGASSRPRRPRSPRCRGRSPSGPRRSAVPMPRPAPAPPPGGGRDARSRAEIAEQDDVAPAATPSLACCGQAPTRTVEPALRVGRVGDAWMPAIPGVALVPVEASAANNGLAAELGKLDLVLVGPSHGGPESTPPAWLADAAATAGVPVLVLPPPTGGETAWHGSGNANATRLPGRLLVLPPVDMRVVNPTGFLQESQDRFAAVAGAGYSPDAGRVSSWLGSETDLPFLTVYARSSRRLSSALRRHGEIAALDPFEAGGVVADLRGCKGRRRPLGAARRPDLPGGTPDQPRAAGVPLLLRDRDPALEDALGPDLLGAIDRFDERMLADAHLREAASVAMRRIALARHGTRSTWAGCPPRSAWPPRRPPRRA